MKRTLLLFAFSILAFVSCKNAEEKAETATTSETPATLNEAKDGLETFKGEFISIEDGAILKVGNTIYAVHKDEMTEDLAKQVAPVKKEDFDMVPVIVRGTVSKKAEGAEGWDDIITIKQIVSVSDQPAEADIRIEDKKN